MADIFEQINLPAGEPLNPKTVVDDRTTLVDFQVYRGLVLFDKTAPAGVYVYTGADGTNVEASWERVDASGGLIDQEDGTTEVTWDSEATLAFAEGPTHIPGRIYEVDVPDTTFTTVPVGFGGTGATTAEDARTNLGITSQEATTYQNIGGNIPTWNQDTTGVAATVTNQGNLATQDDLTATQITALSIPEPVSSTNQVAYASEISGLPTTVAELNLTDFNSAVDTRITTIGDVVVYADAAAFTADSSVTTWHRGDVAILTDTNIAYLYTGTDGETVVTLADDFHQIVSTESLAGLGITATPAQINQLDGVTLGSAASSNTGDFATTAQGALASSSVQPTDMVIVSQPTVDGVSLVLIPGQVVIATLPSIAGNMYKYVSTGLIITITSTATFNDAFFELVYTNTDAQSDDILDISGITANTIPITNTDSTGLVASPIVHLIAPEGAGTVELLAFVGAGQYTVTSADNVRRGDTFVSGAVTYTIDGSFIQFPSGDPVIVFAPNTPDPIAPATYSLSRIPNELFTLDQTYRIRRTGDTGGMIISPYDGIQLHGDQTLVFGDGTTQTTAATSIDLSGIANNTLVATNADSTELVASPISHSTSVQSGVTINLLSNPQTGIFLVDTITGVRGGDQFTSGDVTYTIGAATLSGGVTPFIGLFGITPTTPNPIFPAEYTLSRPVNELFTQDQVFRIRRAGDTQGLIIDPHNGIIFNDVENSIRFGDGTEQTTAGSALPGLSQTLDTFTTGIIRATSSVSGDALFLVGGVGGLSIGDFFTHGGITYTIIRLSFGSTFISEISPAIDIALVPQGTLVEWFSTTVDTITATAHHFNVVDAGETVGLRITPENITFPDASVQTTAYDLNSISETLDDAVEIATKTLITEEAIGSTFIGAGDPTSGGVLAGDYFIINSNRYTITTINVGGYFITPGFVEAAPIGLDITILRDETETVTITGRHLNLTNGVDTLRLTPTSDFLPQRGTWDPAFGPITSITDFTTNSRYIKTGPLVLLHSEITLGTAATLGTDLVLLSTSLPFTPDRTVGGAERVAFGTWFTAVNSNPIGTTNSGVIASSGSSIYLLGNDSDEINENEAGLYIGLTLTYETNE